jgi:hypothetical protein
MQFANMALVKSANPCAVRATPHPALTRHLLPQGEKEKGLSGSAHFPENFGWRFSMNAATPSR